MVTPLPLPVIVLPNVPDWLPLLQPVKVPSSNPASGNEAASTLVTPANIDAVSTNTSATEIDENICLRNIFKSLRPPKYFTLLNLFKMAYIEVLYTLINTQKDVLEFSWLVLASAYLLLEAF
jgi:hypothetical protein